MAFLRSIAERRGRDSDALAATVLTAKWQEPGSLVTAEEWSLPSPTALSAAA